MTNRCGVPSSKTSACDMCTERSDFRISESVYVVSSGAD